MKSFFELPVILAQAAAPAGEGAAPSGPMGGGQMQIIIFVLLMAAMYFLMIAPQRKKQKQHQQMLSSLESGDEVITAGGIFGEITNKKDDRFVVKIADGVKVEIAKGFIQGVVKKANGEEVKK